MNSQVPHAYGSQLRGHVSRQLMFRQVLQPELQAVSQVCSVGGGQVNACTLQGKVFG